MPKYSFVIPVYNVEKYLNECVDSILSQTYKDYEIILVDDGSKDNSGKICDEYAAKYDFIKVIHQENMGLSMARNNGVDAAEGIFIVFLDSDDYWFYNYALKDIDNTISFDVDVLIFPSYKLFESTKGIQKDRYDYPSETLNRMGSEECLCYMIENNLFTVSSALKVFNKEFFLKNKLYYKPGIKSEDIEQWLRVVCCFPTYRFLNKRIYVYRQREGSITKTIDKKHLSDYYGIIKTYCKFSYPSEKMRTHLLSYAGYQYILLFGFVQAVKPDGYKKMLKVLRKYTFLFKYDSYPRTKKIAVFCRLFGYRITTIVIGMILKRKMKKGRG